MTVASLVHRLTTDIILPLGLSTGIIMTGFVVMLESIFVHIGTVLNKKPESSH
jgi:hypothetical protein